MQAIDYFKREGIECHVEPTAEELQALRIPHDHQEVLLAMTSYPCLISVTSVFFYTYVSVSVPSLGKTFTGHSGGLGVGEISAMGVIYFSDRNTLLATTDFGVFFGADQGGVVHVTWGSHGNATAAGVGAGAGAFGGSGSWQ